MRRRQLLAAGAALLAAPGIAAAQGTRVRRIGVLMPSTAASTANLTAALEQGLRELGYAKGANLVLEYRYSGGEAARIPALAQELVRAEVAVVVTTTDEVVRSTAQHTGAIPVVMVNASDPVGNGLVKSLAHPGGKVTGITNLSPEVTGKRIELLKECVPGLRRVVYLWNAGLRGAREVLGEVETAAQRLGLRVEAVEVHNAEGIREAFVRAAAGAGDGLLVQAPNPLLYTQRALVCSLANAARLPSMFNRTEYLHAGGLISYGPNVPEMYRRAAAYVDRILKGESPADLPVEQPSKFELALNLRTAQALGVNIPQNVLARADTIV